MWVYYQEEGCIQSYKKDFAFSVLIVAETKMVTVIAGTGAQAQGTATFKAATPILPQGMSHTGLMPTAQPQPASAPVTTNQDAHAHNAAIQQQLQGHKVSSVLHSLPPATAVAGR